MKSNSLVYISALSVLFLISCNNDDSEDSKNEVVAGFTVNTTDVEVGDSVYFSNTSQYASYYQWDFGDGGLSFDENPGYVYTKSGTFNAQLIAIGDGGGADTALIAMNVTNPDFSIYEGVGVEGATLYSTTWGDISEVYGTDTIYDRITEDDLYFHQAYFQNEGLAFYLYGTTKKLEPTDLIYGISVVSPYTGTTSSGVGVGTSMSYVMDSYGSPVDTFQGTDYWGYLYDDLGADFYSYNTNLVNQIDIYLGSNGSRLQQQPSIELMRKKLLEKVRP